MGYKRMAVNTKTIIVIIIFLSVLITVELSIFAQKTDKEIVREETKIDFEVDVTVRNTGNSTAFNIPLRLGMPTDHPPGQYVTKIETSEEPRNITVDSRGNKDIDYIIEKLEPDSEKKFILNMSLRFLSVDFNIQKNKIGKPGEDRNLTRYLLETQHINVNDSGIQEVALEIARRSNDTLDIARNTYDWVVKNIDYELVPGEATAADTLKNRKGDSGELGALFVTLMRANGIPAKRINGWGHRFRMGEVTYQQNVSHGWAEFYLPGYGWIPADPTFGKERYYQNFAMTNPVHIIMSESVGHHFFERGPPEAGEKEISTEYKIIVKNIETKNIGTENISTVRDLIHAVMFIVPVMFMIFIIYKKSRQRRSDKK